MAVGLGLHLGQVGSPVHQVADTVSQLVGLHTGTGWLYAAADVTPAYNGNAAVSKVQRELVFLQPDIGTALAPFVPNEPLCID